MPVAQPEALPHFLEVEIGGETYTLLLQLNGRKTICPLCGTIKHGPSACRSSYVRLRDNIELNENGDYYERKIFSNEDSTDNEGTPEATRSGEEHRERWETATHQRKKENPNQSHQHSRHKTQRPQTAKIESPTNHGHNAQGNEQFTMQDIISTKRSIDETLSPNNNSPVNHKQTKTAAKCEDDDQDEMAATDSSTSTAGNVFFIFTQLYPIISRLFILIIYPTTLYIL